MSLIAELRLTDASLVMLPSLRAAPQMTLEREWATAADRASDPVLFVWASGGDFEAFEAALPDDPTISEHECIEANDHKRLYRVVVARDTGTTNPTPIDRQTGASRLSVKTTVDGAVMKVRLPDREALTEYIALLRENGFTVQLLRAHTADDDSGRQYDLSSKQEEALQEALGAGYFEVPRETDLTKLADRLDISEQALSERLRRGVSSVLAATVGEPDAQPSKRRERPPAADGDDQ
ncbi:hypothetical protein JCM30237_12030 [Halolamina litorea]|uniref:Helix-turn-helix domain-containing protein n=1 Tax=Halolamina litorea TaxID=1515593 RepID=A0ABD6BMZ1_9EURY|nr:helix-turn-helix domain-containing protein [Halolamina litorea]